MARGKRLSCLVCYDTGGVSYPGNRDEPPSGDICPRAQETGHECPTCGEEIYCCNRPMLEGERAVGICCANEHRFDLVRHEPSSLILEPEDSDLLALEIVVQEAYSLLEHLSTIVGGPSFSPRRASEQCRKMADRLLRAGVGMAEYY